MWGAQAAQARRAATRTHRGVEGEQRERTEGRMPVPPASGVVKMEGQARMIWRHSKMSLGMWLELLHSTVDAEVTRDKRAVAKGRYGLRVLHMCVREGKGFRV